MSAQAQGKSPSSGSPRARTGLREVPVKGGSDPTDSNDGDGGDSKGGPVDTDDVYAADSKAVDNNNNIDTSVAVVGESKGLPIVATTSAAAAAAAILTVTDTESKHTSTPTLLLSSDAKGNTSAPAPVLSSSSSSAAATTAGGGGGGSDSTADSKSIHTSSAVGVSSSSSGLGTGFARAALPHHLPPLAALKVCVLLLIL